MRSPRLKHTPKVSRMGSGGSLRGRPRPYPSPRSLPGRSLVATRVMKHPATGSHALGTWPPPLAPNPKPGPPGHAGSPALRPQPPVTITPIALPRRHSRGPASRKERRRTQGGRRAGPRPCRCSPPLRAAALAPELARAALLSALARRPRAPSPAWRGAGRAGWQAGGRGRRPWKENCAGAR